ncbi:uncharacterized protein [Clytia hemisphaerica]|uniref:uncharacterized protein n=1 Tax=Clytia hemisphaerica TaxID=252671 RepID=UPI0034D5AA4D
MEASFPLRKWRTNSQELREIINEKEEKEINKKNEINKKEKVEYKNEDLQNSKVLGIVWNELDDKLILSVKGLFENVKEEMPTKREILKIIAGIYDPIGFVQPLTIGLKLLFREICLLNVGWDETLPNEICTKWLKVVQSFMNIPAIVVNRYYFTGCSIDDPIEKIYLHGFSDAADLAYGCCVYIKGVTKCENVIINFVTSKSRVVPLKKQEFTIPRKELLGNFILSTLIENVYSSLSREMFIDGYFCWSDSMITLSWIKAIHKEFKTFVENRVNKIRKFVSPSLWNYCSTDDNPADLTTRKENSVHDDLWWQGPSFLLENIEKTLHEKNLPSLGEDSLIEFEREEKKSVLININEVHHSIGKVIVIEKFSCLQKLYRITAYVLRFLRNIRVPKEERVMTSELNVDEIREAEFRWIKENQTIIDQEDRQQLEKCLNVTLDTKGLLRTNDRIKNADIPYETRSPIVINREHKLAELITIDCHRLVQHLGARQTLAEIRNRFWITRGRSFVRGVLAKYPCPCKKFNPRHYRYPEEADLPKLRLRDDVPFSGTGVDYFGPILCKNVYIEDELEDELYKSYTALYTCATTRGVVLDLVQDATATAFVSSLIRFIARRGCPQKVLSDNPVCRVWHGCTRDFFDAYWTVHLSKIGLNVRDLTLFY